MSLKNNECTCILALLTPNTLEGACLRQGRDLLAHSSPGRKVNTELREGVKVKTKFFLSYSYMKHWVTSRTISALFKKQHKK